MEIERKWMVRGWPEDLPLLYEQNMRQGYLTVRPTVRIREEAMLGGKTHYILCFKTGSGIVRKELEIELTKDHFEELEDMIGLPLIPKVRRTYQLSDGLKLEVNHVDQGLDTEFWYAEVEYPDKAAALSWNPASVNLSSYLDQDVSEQPGQTMGEYWILTREGKLSDHVQEELS